jgi:hypothetical protein
MSAAVMPMPLLVQLPLAANGRATRGLLRSRHIGRTRRPQSGSRPLRSCVFLRGRDARGAGTARSADGAAVRGQHGYQLAWCEKCFRSAAGPAQTQVACSHRGGS